MKMIQQAADFPNQYRERVGFVPTMGALHDGHLKLIELSRAQNDMTVVSIFVNPMQFNNLQDFSNYPRNIDHDAKLLAGAGCDLLFNPTPEEIYPKDDAFKLTESEITKVLCGPARPGHFEGVGTVVLKLLNIVKPTRAYFGEKDFQQLKLIQTMAKAFFLPVEIIGVPTVRDDAGLALSSRNFRLSSGQLQLAREVTKLFFKDLPLQQVRSRIEALDIRLDYLTEIWDRRFIAYFIGDVRLIDNFPLREIA